MGRLAISWELGEGWHPPWEVCVGRTARSWLAQALGEVESARMADQEIQQERWKASYFWRAGGILAPAQGSVCRKNGGQMGRNLGGVDKETDEKIQ